jgi:hypothetical protein
MVRCALIRLHFPWLRCSYQGSRTPPLDQKVFGGWHLRGKALKSEKDNRFPPLEDTDLNFEYERWK